VICRTGGGYVICGVSGGWGGWLWHNDMIDSMPELIPGSLGEFVAERVNGRMENIGGEAVPIALCDSLL
jgi:hypothetical protein